MKLIAGSRRRGLLIGGRRRRNVYDKKSQRYAKDNRTAHLTVRSDKSVAIQHSFTLSLQAQNLPFPQILPTLILLLPLTAS